MKNIQTYLHYNRKAQLAMEIILLAAQLGELERLYRAVNKHDAICAYLERL